MTTNEQTAPSWTPQQLKTLAYMRERHADGLVQSREEEGRAIAWHIGRQHDHYTDFEIERMLDALGHP